MRTDELRTPLNNLLILARMLAENTDSNLSPKQVKFAETIHSSDLPKIESGKMDVELGGVRFTDLQDYVSRTFRHVADAKGLDLGIELESSLPISIHTDAKRLQQILKNLLSNALKFTAEGSVQLRMEKAAGGWRANHPVLNRAKSVIAFTVTDTGIGIPEDKQKIIFEAFQQADGTTSRRFGGTGLGLSISRELARLLGGEIRLQSEPGRRSSFTLYLPQTYISPTFMPKTADDGRDIPVIVERLPLVIPGKVDVILPTPKLKTAMVEQEEEITVDDDRNSIEPGDITVLIVEDDQTFARILIDLAHERGLKVLLAVRGATALSLAKEFKPGAITLDIGLPDMAGWTILDQLKHDTATRHISVHVISADENSRRGLALGAITYLEKSLTKQSLEKAFDSARESAPRRTRQLLVFSADAKHASRLGNLFNGEGVEVSLCATHSEVLNIVKSRYLDCLIVSYAPNLDTGKLLADVAAHFTAGFLPTIVYLREPLSKTDRVDVLSATRNGTVKIVDSEERLLEESVILLHRADSELYDEQHRPLNKVRQVDSARAGKKALVVDDDVRNIFALTSVLEHHNREVIHAENGRAGIERLRETPDVDIVLMDIMMPEMDGYETTRAIRELPHFRNLPIIALTAKAMKGDREKCIEAGASDYVTKPVDLDQLLSVLRVWMTRGHEYTSTRPGST